MGSIGGIILIAANTLLRSGYYVLTEVYLKKDLKNVPMADKQMITAGMDVMAYLLTIWIEILLMGRSWNPVHGLFAHWSYFPTSVANAISSGMWIPVMQNTSAIMVAIINVVAMGATW